MGATSNSMWGRLDRARYYRALAEALSLSECSIAEQFVVLREMPCADLMMPSSTVGVEEQVAQWIAEGEQPRLSELLQSLFGVGFCYKELPTIPACMAFYVRDADGGRERLRELYDRWGYHESRTFSPKCEGTGYISRLLAFAAHCLEHGDAEPEIFDVAARELQESLFDWAPLFARALVVSRSHPAVAFVGMKLECLLAHEHELSDPAFDPLSRASLR